MPVARYRLRAFIMGDVWQDANSLHRGGAGRDDI